MKPQYFLPLIALAPVCMGAMSIVGPISMVVWIIVSFIVGRWASKRGRSKWGWLLFALVIDPIVAALVLLLVGNKK